MATSPAAVFCSGVGFIQRSRRQGYHGMTVTPAASCTIRFGSAARILRWRSELALPHSAISASARPQPVRWSARASSAQTSMQSDFRLSAVAASSTRTQNHSRCQLMGGFETGRFRTGKAETGCSLFGLGWPIADRQLFSSMEKKEAVHSSLGRMPVAGGWRENSEYRAIR